LLVEWIHLVEAIGVGLAAVGLWHTADQLKLTVDQIEQAKVQLEQAKLALRANTIFSIQRDGRELVGSIASDTHMLKLIYDDNNSEPVTDELRLRARIKVGQLINFYASMFNQYRAGAIDERFWRTGHADMCFLLNKTFVRSMWRAIQEHPEGYQADFLAEGQTCFPNEKT
jgi:hypothetical protein